MGLDLYSPVDNDKPLMDRWHMDIPWNPDLDETKEWRWRTL